MGLLKDFFVLLSFFFPRRNQTCEETKLSDVMDIPKFIKALSEKVELAQINYYTSAKSPKKIHKTKEFEMKEEIL